MKIRIKMTQVTSSAEILTHAPLNTGPICLHNKSGRTICAGCRRQEGLHDDLPEPERSENRAFRPGNDACGAVWHASAERDEKDKSGDDDGFDTGLATKTRTKTKRPSLYRVLLLNDDYTPMEFVVAGPAGGLQPQPGRCHPDHDACPQKGVG